MPCIRLKNFRLKTRQRGGRDAGDDGFVNEREDCRELFQAHGPELQSTKNGLLLLCREDIPRTRRLFPGLLGAGISGLAAALSELLQRRRFLLLQ